MEARAQGRVLAWLALFVALVTSVAANVAFAQPHAGPRLSSSVAPILVILAAGLLERVPLAGVQWWRRLLAYLGLGVVIGAAFVTSFEHQFALLVRYGNSRLSSALLPIAVDGLIVLASVCLTVIAERRAAQSSAARISEPPAAQISGFLSCVSPERSPTAQPAPAFVAEVRPGGERQPAAASPMLAPRSPAPPRRYPPEQKIRADVPKAAQREQAWRMCAEGKTVAEIRAQFNGDGPSKRTVEYWTQELRDLPMEARAGKLAELLALVGTSATTTPTPPDPGSDT